MDDRQSAILARARMEQRGGNAGNAIKLYMLASEAKTMRFGPERAHKG